MKKTKNYSQETAKEFEGTLFADAKNQLSVWINWHLIEVDLNEINLWEEVDNVNKEINSLLWKEIKVTVALHKISNDPKVIEINSI